MGKRDKSNRIDTSYYQTLVWVLSFHLVCLPLWGSPAGPRQEQVVRPINGTGLDLFIRSNPAPKSSGTDAIIEALNKSKGQDANPAVKSDRKPANSDKEKSEKSGNSYTEEKKKTTNTTEQNDSKETVPGDLTRQTGARGPNLENGNGRNSPPKSSPNIEFPRYYKPVCFLFDQSISDAAGDKIIKQVADAYGACDVAIQPFAIPIRGNYGDKAEQINAYAQKFCDAPQKLGVKHASVQTHVNNDTSADDMCGTLGKKRDKDGNIIPDTAGCATLGSPLGSASLGMEKILEQVKTGGHSGGANVGGLGLSIVDRTANDDPRVATHELHHNDGAVNIGDGDQLSPHGFGLQSPGRISDPTIEDLKGGDHFEDIACQYAQNTANQNLDFHEWDKSRTDYYTYAGTDGELYDITLGESYFGDGKFVADRGKENKLPPTIPPNGSKSTKLTDKEEEKLPDGHKKVLKAISENEKSDSPQDRATDSAFNGNRGGSGSTEGVTPPIQNAIVQTGDPKVFDKTFFDETATNPNAPKTEGGGNGNLLGDSFAGTGNANPASFFGGEGSAEGNETGSSASGDSANKIRTPASSEKTKKNYLNTIPYKAGEPVDSSSDE